MSLTSLSSWDIQNVLTYYKQSYEDFGIVPDNVIEYFQNNDHRLQFDVLKLFESVYIPLRYELFLRETGPYHRLARWIGLMKHRYDKNDHSNYHKDMLNFLQPHRKDLELILDDYLAKELEFSKNPNNILQIIHQLPGIEFQQYLYLSPTFQDYFLKIHIHSSTQQMLSSFFKKDEYLYIRLGLKLQTPQTDMEKEWCARYNLLGSPLFSAIEVEPIQELPLNIN